MNTPSSSEPVGQKATTAIRAPRSLAEAQRLCELFADLDGQIAAIEDARDAAIAAANAEVDKDLAPLLVQRAAIVGKLAPWWAVNAGQLTQGKRKSAELGGVVMASRSGRVSVHLRREADAIIADLRKTAWGKALLRTKVDIDRVAVATALAGKRAADLEALGLALERGPDVFAIERTGQAGTQAKVQR